jgi:hypothetical protein
MGINGQFFSAIIPAAGSGDRLGAAVPKALDPKPRAKVSPRIEIGATTAPNNFFFISIPF